MRKPIERRMWVPFGWKGIREMIADEVV